MAATLKSAQLQIRVSEDEKRAIARAAQDAGMDMSSYVLERVLGAQQQRIAELMRRLGSESTRGYVFAELNDLLVSLSAPELRRAVATPPPASLPPEVANYLAAMIEQACAARNMEAPAWTHDIPPLATPVFGSTLMSLRLHLLANSPPPFRRRNVFIDTSIGGRV